VPIIFSGGKFILPGGLSQLSRQDHRLDLGEVNRKGSRRLLKSKGYGVAVGLFQAVNATEDGASAGADLSPPFQGGNYVPGGHFPAVVEEHLLSQLKNEPGGVRAHLKSVHQVGHRPEAPVVGKEGFKNVLHRYLGNRSRGPAGVQRRELTDVRHLKGAPEPGGARGRLRTPLPG